MTDETGWEDFKEPEISSEELSNRLKEYIEEKPSTVLKVAFPELLEEMVQFANKVPIDRFGKCPHCENSWRGPDIYEELLRKSVLAVSIGDAKKAAAMYGWTETDKKRFSNVITYELEIGTFVQCHSCGHLFNSETSEEYRSISDVKQGRKLNIVETADNDSDDDIQELREVDDCPF